MTSISSVAPLLVAASELNAVRLIRAAISSDNASAGPGAPLQKITPRPVYRPEPRFEPRPVYRPEPRFEVRPVHRPEPVVVPAAGVCGVPDRVAPAAWPEPAALPAVRPSPQVLLKIYPQTVEITDKGRIIDQFL